MFGCLSRHLYFQLNPHHTVACLSINAFNRFNMIAFQSSPSNSFLFSVFIFFFMSFFLLNFPFSYCTTCTMYVLCIFFFFTFIKFYIRKCTIIIFKSALSNIFFLKSFTWHNTCTCFFFSCLVFQ